MIKSYVSLEDMIMQVQGNIVSDMSGEKVMLSVKNGKYYNLGKTGGEIWELIEEPVLVLELINSLTTIYEVEKADCEAHVLPFLEHLLKEELIEISFNS